MSLVYITGPSGSGKSSLAVHLSKLGYESYDADVDLCSWFNDASGERVEYPRLAHDRPVSWQDHHSFLMSDDLVKQLHKKESKKPIFILGHSPNDLAIAKKYFDKVFCLQIDKQTMVDRLSSRTNNNYGKDPDQREIVLKWYQPTLDRYTNYGAEMIDASKPLDQVARNILSSLNE